MSTVPQWVVESLGQIVALSRDFEGPCEHYAKGHPCRLLSIQWRPTGIYLTVALDRLDEGYEENIELDAIEPLRQ